MRRDRVRWGALLLSSPTPPTTTLPESFPTIVRGFLPTAELQRACCHVILPSDRRAGPVFVSFDRRRADYRSALGQDSTTLVWREPPGQLAATRS